MTDRRSHAASNENAQEVRMRAARWAQRRQFWNWSEEDQAELDRWLAESPSHHVAYMRVVATWNRTERLTALRGSPSAGERGRWRFGWPFLVGGAAAIALISVLGFSGFRYAELQKQTTWTTPVGGREILTLGDGSKIELNTNTVLRVSADQRTAWLDRGEAYFQIRHDSAHPFTVTAANKRVVDVGTKFLVRYRSDDLEVALVEGKARVEPAKSRRGLQIANLTPGDIALVSGNTFSVISVPMSRLTRELSWRNNLLIFDNVTLADVAAELNRYNHEQLVIADPDVASMKIVASIPTNGVQAFKRVARDFLGLHVEERGREIIISH